MQVMKYGSTSSCDHLKNVFIVLFISISLPLFLFFSLSQDQEITAGTDGSYLGMRYFRCPTNKGLFVKLRSCRRDSRFPAPETPINQVERCNSIGV